MSQKKKYILIVDGNASHRATIKNALVQNYAVLEASSGDSAKKAIEDNSFDLIISDMLPDSEGVALLTWVKMTKPTPIILMIGFSQIIETQKAHDLGADDFISKPCNLPELQAKVQKALGEKIRGAGVEIPPVVDRDYCRIPIDDFISEKEVGHNLFIKHGRQSVTSKFYIKAERSTLNESELIKRKVLITFISFSRISGKF